MVIKKWFSEKNVVRLIVILAIFYAFYINFKRVYLLRNYGVCTVGLTFEKQMGGTTSYIVYKYRDKMKTYTMSRGAVKGVKVPYGKYLVVYYKNNPEISSIIYEMPMEEYKFGTNVDSIVDRSKLPLTIWY